MIHIWNNSVQKKKKQLRKHYTKKCKYEHTMNAIPKPLGRKWLWTDWHAIKNQSEDTPPKTWFYASGKLHTTLHNTESFHTYKHVYFI